MVTKNRRKSDLGGVEIRVSEEEKRECVGAYSIVRAKFFVPTFSNS
jgi:hypothetical protein